MYSSKSPSKEKSINSQDESLQIYVLNSVEPHDINQEGHFKLSATATQTYQHYQNSCGIQATIHQHPSSVCTHTASYSQHKLLNKKLYLLKQHSRGMF